MSLTAQRLSLTFVAGSLVGGVYVVSKLLMVGGLSPIAVSLIQVIGASTVLLAILTLRGGRLPTDAVTWRFFGLSALIAVTATALLGNWVLARIPAGIFTVLVTLSPMFTSLLNTVLDRRLPSPTAMAGTGLGLAGVALVLVPRAQAVEAEQALALVAALGVPVLLAIGNVYRGRRWPQALSAPVASAGTMLVQAIALIPLFFSARGDTTLADLAAVWPLLAVLVAIAIAANVSAAALQRIADPVAYSQIGYVIALTGVVAGALVFGERLGVLFIPAVALVFAGVVLANRAPAPRAAKPPLFAVAAAALTQR